jgi:predicted amidohydrolase YtcJ
MPVFPGGAPRRQLLDRLVPDRPAFLSSADGHTAWVNSRALRIAGIDRKTPDPPGGRIDRDASGAPSGTLREDAIHMVSRHVPLETAEERLVGLRKALALAARFGITSLQEASAGEEELVTYAELEGQGQLTARITASLRVDPGKGEAQVEDFKRLRAKYRGPLLRVASAKIFADGVMESHAAALLAPYLDRPDDRGKLLLEPDLFNRLVTCLEREGFQVHVHAIGDRAVRTALDAFEDARKRNGPLDARHHVAHLELVDPADIPRFRKLGVAANFQPLWAWRDDYIIDLTEPFLGPERSGRLYPIGSILRSDAIVVAGSDWDVTSMNPLEAIEVAVTRRAPGEMKKPPWIPGERADLHSILAAYTRNGAYLAHAEGETGSLEAGKAADMVVLDRDLFEVPPQEIHRARVLLTLLGGRVVFRDQSFAWP